MIPTESEKMPLENNTNDTNRALAIMLAVNLAKKNDDLSVEGVLQELQRQGGTFTEKEIIEELERAGYDIVKEDDIVTTTSTPTATDQSEQGPKQKKASQKSIASLRREITKIVKEQWEGEWPPAIDQEFNKRAKALGAIKLKYKGKRGKKSKEDTEALEKSYAELDALVQSFARKTSEVKKSHKDTATQHTATNELPNPATAAYSTKRERILRIKQKLTGDDKEFLEEQGWTKDDFIEHEKAFSSHANLKAPPVGQNREHRLRTTPVLTKDDEDYLRTRGWSDADFLAHEKAQIPYELLLAEKEQLTERIGLISLKADRVSPGEKEHLEKSLRPILEALSGIEGKRKAVLAKEAAFEDDNTPRALPSLETKGEQTIRLLDLEKQEPSFDSKSLSITDLERIVLQKLTDPNLENSGEVRQRYQTIQTRLANHFTNPAAYKEAVEELRVLVEELHKNESVPKTENSLDDTRKASHEALAQITEASKKKEKGAKLKWAEEKFGSLLKGLETVGNNYNTLSTKNKLLIAGGVLAVGGIMGFTCPAFLCIAGVRRAVTFTGAFLAYKTLAESSASFAFSKRGKEKLAIAGKNEWALNRHPHAFATALSALTLLAGEYGGKYIGELIMADKTGGLAKDAKEACVYFINNCVNQTVVAEAVAPTPQAPAVTLHAPVSPPAVPAEPPTRIPVIDADAAEKKIHLYEKTAERGDTFWGIAKTLLQERAPLKNFSNQQIANIMNQFAKANPDFNINKIFPGDTFSFEELTDGEKKITLTRAHGGVYTTTIDLDKVTLGVTTDHTSKPVEYFKTPHPENDLPGIPGDEVPQEGSGTQSEEKENLKTEDLPDQSRETFFEARPDTTSLEVMHREIPQTPPLLSPRELTALAGKLMNENLTPLLGKEGNLLGFGGYAWFQSPTIKIYGDTPASAILSQDPKLLDLKDVPTIAEYTKLHSLLYTLSARTGIIPTSNQTVMDFLDRTFKEAAQKNISLSTFV